MKNFIELEDVGSHIPDLNKLVLIRATGSDATLTGHYQDMDGYQLGNIVTYTISTTPVTFLSLATAAGSTIPAGAEGFLGNLNAPVYCGLTGQPDGTYQYAPKAGNTLVPTGDRIVFARGNAGVQSDLSGAELTGFTTDAVWTGTGSASMIALLKAIALGMRNAGSFTDWSSYLTMAGSPNVIPPDANRRYLFIQNTDATHNLTLAFGSNTPSQAIVLLPYGIYELEGPIIDPDIVYLNGTLTGQTYVVKVLP